MFHFISNIFHSENRNYDKVNQNYNGHNHYPLTEQNGEFLEGFWTEGEWSTIALHWIDDPNSNLPFPKPEKNEKDRDFINQLSWIMAHIKRCKKAIKSEKNCAGKKLIDDFGFDFESHLGNSKCRLCGNDNGNGEFLLKKEEIIFRFPEGIHHYYEDHNVKPSSEFSNFVKKYFAYVSK
jgi:hypothetical protein